MNNILIIEDEIRVSSVLKAYLEKEKFRVFCTETGKKGLEIFNEIKFDLVILDLMLPDIQGEDICKRIRSISDTYIFILTAKGALDEKIEGYSSGADEYIVKPFSPRELTAKIKALFRRFNGEADENMVFDNGKLIINKYKRYVKVNGKEVVLTPYEFDILYILAFNKSIVFSREMLIEKIFGIDYKGNDRAIDVHIKNIRKKIEEDTKNPRYIKTVTRIGYKFGVDE